MIVDQAGEVIVDFLTLSPSLAEIPSASAILDVSNFTFQAISYGKDASGFNNHAHLFFDPEFSAIIVQSFEATSVSSYHSSAIPDYRLMPSYPDPLDKRLEKLPCRTLDTNFSGMDVGQCANHAILSAYSTNFWKLGCFAPSGGINYYVVTDTDGYINKVLYSGTLAGAYNTNGVMDGSGFLTFPSLNGSQGTLSAAAGYFSSGVLLNLSSNFSSTGRVSVVWRLDAADAGALLLYGGVYHLGLWCLDVKAMLAAGHKPPFAFNPLNNIRKYRLFAKKTFNRDLLYINDGTGTLGAGLAGFNSLFNPPNDAAWDDYILYQWTIRFL
jgi:hypothetical protein